MQYRYLTQAFRGSDAFDGLTRLGRLRVPSRGEDDANQFVSSEPTRLTSQATLSGTTEAAQGLVDQRQDDLRFGIAEPDVELDDLRAVRCQHQADVQKAAERMALGGHAAMTGSTISRMTRASKLASTSRLGANAPIPPVFGPRSSSKIRL